MTTVDTIKLTLLNGAATAFVTIDAQKLCAVVIVEIMQYPSHRVARITACAGTRLKEALKWLPALEMWAVSYEATELDGWCRPAMARLAKRLGFTEKQIRVSRDLRRNLQ